QRTACSHGGPARLSEQPLGDRAPARAADIDARDRAPRAGADSAGFKRDGKSRPAEFLLQTRRNEPDNAWMPALGRSHDDCAFVLDTECGIRFGFGLRQRFLFDRLPLAVEPIAFSDASC